MTIAITVRVFGGVVLGADSAGSFIDRRGQTEKVYYNSSKMFELREGLPIGAVTWGLGTFGSLSIAAMVRPIAALLARGGQYEVNPESYSVEDVAINVRKFLFHNYGVAHGRSRTKRSPFFLLIAGYSSGRYDSEEWLIKIDDTGQCPEVQRVRGVDEYGLLSFAENYATDLLVNGYSEYLPLLARGVGISDRKVDELMLAFKQIRTRLDPVRPHMPIRDAIELVNFLATVECGYSRLIPNQPAPTVGPPIEIMAITRTDGLRWVERTNHFRPIGRT